MKSLPAVSKLAIAALALLALGPLLAGLDLAFNFMPKTYSAVQNLHAASAPGIFTLQSAAILAVASALLARRSPTKAALVGLVFVGLYITGAHLVWRQFTLGCWLAIIAFALLAFAAYRHEA